MLSWLLQAAEKKVWSLRSRGMAMEYIRDPAASLPRGSRSEVVVLASTTYVSSMAHAAGSRSLAAELLVIYLVITAVYQLR